MIKKWPYKLKSLNLKNEKYLKNDKKWSCIAGFKVFLKIKGCNNTITQVGQKRWYKMDLFNTSTAVSYKNATISFTFPCSCLEVCFYGCNNGHAINAFLPKTFNS